MKINSKICKNPECHASGEPQELEAFQVNYRRREKYGDDPVRSRLDTCRACMGRKRSGSKKRMGIAKTGKPFDDLKPKSTIAKQQSEIENHQSPIDNPKRWIRVDLEKCPDLYDEIVRIAEAEERTIDAQVRYWLKNKVLPSVARGDAV